MTQFSPWFAPAERNQDDDVMLMKFLDIKIINIYLVNVKQFLRGWAIARSQEEK